jgi:chemotaxis protein methyltransferase CheR
MQAMTMQQTTRPGPARRRTPEQLVPMTDAVYREFVELVHRHTGISLGDAKRELAHARLARRIRTLGLGDYESYVKRLRSGDPEELACLPTMISTNVTSFFREGHHFDELAARLRARLAGGQARFRLWSAGCSNGSEPVSMALTLARVFEGRPDVDWRILATDIDPKMVAFAREGRYPLQQLADVPRETLRLGMQRHGEYARLRPELAERIVYRELNLFHEWPMKGPLDAIFCRNVLIYFNDPDKSALIDRFAALQRSGDMLAIGHSESVLGMAAHYRAVGKTFHERL